MYIKYDYWIGNQEGFDIANEVNGLPRRKWNGRVAPYHQVLAEVMMQEASKGIKLSTEHLDSVKITLQNREEPTMKVSYNGFTGELVKIERRAGLEAVIPGYNLEIWDDEKKVAYSFQSINLSDVKFIGGAVSFE